MTGTIKSRSVNEELYSAFIKWNIQWHYFNFLGVKTFQKRVLPASPKPDIGEQAPAPPGTLEAPRAQPGKVGAGQGEPPVVHRHGWTAPASLPTPRCLCRLPRSLSCRDRDQRLRPRARSRAGPGPSPGRARVAEPSGPGGLSPARGRHRGVAPAPTPRRSARPAAGGTRTPSNQRLWSGWGPAPCLCTANQSPSMGGVLRRPPPPLRLIQARWSGKPRIRLWLAALLANSAAQRQRRRAVIGCESGGGPRGRAWRGSRGGCAGARCAAVAAMGQRGAGRARASGAWGRRAGGAGGSPGPGRARWAASGAGRGQGTGLGAVRQGRGWRGRLLCSGRAPAGSGPGHRGPPRPLLRGCGSRARRRGSAGGRWLRSWPALLGLPDTWASIPGGALATPEVFRDFPSPSCARGGEKMLGFGLGGELFSKAEPCTEPCGSCHGTLRERTRRNNEYSL